MDEIVLIKDAQGGDRTALNELLTGNYNILKGYSLKITGDASLAQDITQEAMLKAIVNIKKYDPKAKFSTYLIAIATNVYRDYLRKNKRLQSMDENMEMGSDCLENIIMDNMQYKDILIILSSMTYEKKTVFILKHYYGYKYEEIAKILSCPVGTVRSRLHNSIEFIKCEMKRRKLI